MNIKRYVVPALLALSTIFVMQLGDLQPASAQQEASRRDRLVFGLKARHQSEITYLEAISLAVDQGNIPAESVDQTFFWVRERKTNTNFPFIYFQRIITLRAAKEGFNLPPYTGPYK